MLWYVVRALDTGYVDVGVETDSSGDANDAENDDDGVGVASGVTKPREK